MRLYDSQGIPRRYVIGLALRTTSIKMHGENYKKGRNPVCLVGGRTTFQNSRMKFPQIGENIKYTKIGGVKMELEKKIKFNIGAILEKFQTFGGQS